MYREMTHCPWKIGHMSGICQGWEVYYFLLTICMNYPFIMLNNVASHLFAVAAIVHMPGTVFTLPSSCITSNAI